MGGPSDKAVKEGRGPWEGLMDREIWCTSGLSIGTWEIGTAGTRMGREGRGRQVRTFFDAGPDDTFLAGTYRTYHLLRAQLARARRGSARVLLAVCSETVASQNTRTGWVGMSGA